MRINKSIILNIIGTAIAVVLFMVVAFAIGIKTKVAGQSDGFTLATKNLVDLAKIDLFKNIKEFIGMYATALTLVLLAFLFALLRIFLGDGADFIMILLTIVLVAVGGILLIAETSKWLKDMTVEVLGETVSAADKGMFAANYILTVVGLGAGVALSAVALKR